MKTRTRIITALATLLLTGAAHGHGSGDHANATGADVFTQVFQVRKATSRFRSFENARAAGYAQFLDCTSEPGEGAMGTHFIHGELIADTVIDALRPEALMFEQGSNGQMRLVGVEYIVFQDGMDAENASPPSLFGKRSTG